jgi:hypothetical protein
MKYDRLMSRALRLLRKPFCKKKHAGRAIALLTPEVVTYHDSWLYRYCLGAAYTRISDFGNAFTWFNDAWRLNKDEWRIEAGLAALFLRRGDRRRAVNLYLDVQRRVPKNRFAKLGLKVLRTRMTPESLNAWVESWRFRRLFPKTPFSGFRASDFLRPLGLVVALAVLGAIVGVQQGYIQNPIKLPPPRAGFTESALNMRERDAPVETGGSYNIILTQKQALETYEKGRSLFASRHDERARVEMNRLLLSNASQGVKAKAQIILQNLSSPDWSNLKDRITYKEAAANPALYANCAVIWGGRTADIVNKKGSTSFKLLVGYEDMKVLEGQMPVFCPFAVQIAGDKPIEVLGILLWSGGKQLLQAISVHQK